MSKEAYIRFMAPVVPQTTDKLLKILDSKIKHGYDKIHLLISSPGGLVFHGLSLYNFIKGSPVEIDTYNFGSVDSIGVVIFCAGKTRYCVPHARFLIHGVSMNFNRQESLGEIELGERLKSLKIDQHNISKVIADTTEKKQNEVEKDMNDRITLNPEEALKYKLIHHIQSQLFPANAELHTIYEPEFDQLQTPIMPGFPSFPGPVIIQNPTVKNENFTSIFDKGFTFTCSY